MNERDRQIDKKRERSWELCMKCGYVDIFNHRSIHTKQQFFKGKNTSVTVGPSGIRMMMTSCDIWCVSLTLIFNLLIGLEI